MGVHDEMAFEDFRDGCIHAEIARLKKELSIQPTAESESVRILAAKLAAKDAEIAKLREAATKAHQDGYAEGRKHRVAAVETHADEMHRAQDEIAKLRADKEAQRKTIGELEDVSVQWMTEAKRLRADLDQARRDRNSAVECAEVLRGYVAEGKAEIAKLRAERAIHLASIAEHSQQLAAARAALDGEREACDQSARAYYAGWSHVGRSFHEWENDRRARRAAEAKASRGGEEGS